MDLCFGDRQNVGGIDRKLRAVFAIVSLSAGG